MAGVEHSVKAIQKVSEAVQHLVDLFKKPMSMESVPEGLKLAGDLVDVALEASKALPELKDLEADELKELGVAAVEAFRALMDSLGSVKAK